MSRKGTPKPPIAVAPEPCGSCPYRRDVPPGVWDASEYRKLAEFDLREGHVPAVSTFLCHQTHSLGRETLCRGWLSVHADSVAVKLGVLLGTIDPATIDAPVKAPLFSSGSEACAAGLAGVRRPSRQARRLVASLTRKLGLRNE